VRCYSIQHSPKVHSQGSFSAFGEYRIDPSRRQKQSHSYHSVLNLWQVTKPGSARSKRLFDAYAINYYYYYYYYCEIACEWAALYRFLRVAVLGGTIQNAPKSISYNVLRVHVSYCTASCCHFNAPWTHDYLHAYHYY
jgi:hypothetical protein